MLLRDITLSGVAHPEAYRKCIAARSNFTLKDTIKICQSEDLTRGQFAAPELDLQTTTSAITRTALNSTGSHIELGDFQPETLHDLYA